MIHASSTENVADDDASYPLPPDIEVGGDVAQTASTDTDIVPAPPQSATIPTLPVPRARREVKTAIAEIKTAMAVLKQVEAGERPQADALAIDALVCGATDRRFPLDDGEPDIDRLRDSAKKGRFTAHLPLALDELEDALATLEAALSALKAISLLDEPIPGAWGNLHAVLLARKLNFLGHTLLRGRIAGVNL